MAWPAVLVVARAELRRRWVALVVLGVITGLAAGVVTSAVAMATRTGTAHARLMAATHLDDARVAVFDGSGAATEIAALPMVRASWIAGSVVGQVYGLGGVQFLSVTAGPPRPADLITPVVIAGRAPDPAAADEVLLAEDAAEFYRARPGSTIDIALMTPEEFLQFDTGFGEPDGPRLQLRVTGLGRMTTWGNGFGPALATPAFAARYGRYFAGDGAYLRLDGTPGAQQRLTAAVDAIAARQGPTAGGEEFGAMRAEFPQSADRVSVATSERVLVTGLVVFAALVALAGLLATGQGLARHHAGGAGDQQVESALGLTAGERVVARLLPASLGALTAAAVTVAVALASAGLEPLGALRRYEPHPGWMPNGRVIALGALAVAAVFLSAAALTARRAAGSRAQAGTWLPGSGWAPAVLRPAWLHAGLSLALRPDGRRGAGPVVATLAGATLGIAGLVGAATFGGALHRLADDPARYGWTASFGSSDVKPADLARYVADDRIDAVDLVGEKTIRAAGRAVPVLSYDHRKGTLPWTTLAGRLPHTADEVAVGPRLAADLDVGIGDRARFADSRLRVVGIVLAPPTGRQDRTGRAAVTTPAGLERLGNGNATMNALVHVRDPRQAAAVQASYAKELELFGAEPPQDVRSLTELGRLPDVLGLVLALVAAAAVGNALIVTTRRRSYDLAVMRTVGFSPGQVAGAVVTMGLVTAAVAVAIGAPLGLALGRVVWSEVAASTSIAGDMFTPVGVLVALVPAALLGAAVVAVLPSIRAARLRPATVLHAE